MAALRGEATQSVSPNFVVILCDDLGYGDLGCYGSRIRTPNLDRMAEQGALFRQFSSASPVCSPSRAALLTGRYGVRVGVPYVVGPENRAGLNLSEVTLAQTLKQAGYRTMCVGKWHLGTTTGYLPTFRGFDEWYGMPYSNDNSPFVLMRNTEVIEQPLVQQTLTRRYTDEAVRFIRGSKDRPFFLYMPHTFPHIPLAASADFEGKSPLGLYGEVVEELDWSVGNILIELENQGIAKTRSSFSLATMGLGFKAAPVDCGGERAILLKAACGSPFWPGDRAAFLRDRSYMVSPVCSIYSRPWRGAPVPRAPRNPLDGVNILPMLTGEAETVDRPPFLYFDGYHLQCARVGRWKVHFSRFNGPAFAPTPTSGRMNLPLLNPEMYDVLADPEEAYCLAEQNPRVLADIRGPVETLLPSLPEAVQAAWRETQARPTSPVNAGEWPSCALRGHLRPVRCRFSRLMPSDRLVLFVLSARHRPTASAAVVSQSGPDCETLLCHGANSDEARRSARRLHHHATAQVLRGSAISPALAEYWPHARRLRLSLSTTPSDSMAGHPLPTARGCLGLPLRQPP